MPKPDVPRTRPAPWLFERVQIALMVGGFVLLPIAIWWPL